MILGVGVGWFVGDLGGWVGVWGDFGGLWGILGLGFWGGGGGGIGGAFGGRGGGNWLGILGVGWGVGGVANILVKVVGEYGEGGVTRSQLFCISLFVGLFSLLINHSMVLTPSC